MFFSIVYPSHLLVFLCMCECIWVFLPEINFTYLLTYLLELIRALLDPFQASHTIIGTSDSFRLPRTHSELP